eukprot:TRINITY_DN88748_c0_g1_i1.p1 TRINITY_DN88748_c0_g1~~TRINITY_DN88748_c0_g1_i1.p1  ORF type:complete len:198 (+),score=28.34 TRINITY_DN88748_c0_g1_i1:114-707(+)
MPGAIALTDTFQSTAWKQRCDKEQHTCEDFQALPTAILSCSADHSMQYLLRNAPWMLLSQAPAMAAAASPGPGTPLPLSRPLSSSSRELQRSRSSPALRSAGGELGFFSRPSSTGGDLHQQRPPSSLSRPCTTGGAAAAYSGDGGNAGQDLRPRSSMRLGSDFKTRTLQGRPVYCLAMPRWRNTAFNGPGHRCLAPQ